jgi:hypothetical protein
MAFNISTFQSKLKQGGARPTLFEVLLTPPPALSLGDFTEFRFMIQATSLPESQIDSIPVPYFGRTIKVAGDRKFQDWSVSVLNDEDFAVRTAMERWHNSVNSLETNLNLAQSSAPANYKVDSTVTQFSKLGTPLRSYKFKGLFPVNIGSIELSWASTDQIETFPITFSYDYYEILNGGPTGPVII